MCVVRKIINFLFINIIATFAFYCLNIYPVYAASNSLASETLILTPNGNIPIEELHSGDLVIGYNFETHQEEIHHVKDIRQSRSLSYYLINDQTKVTGTHYIYVKTPNNPKIERVQQLKVKDRLFGQNHQDYPVDGIEQIVKSFNLYQIILEEKNSNFFTDHFLIYSGNKITNNFNTNYKHIDCGVGAPYSSYRSRECINIYSAFPGSLIALAFWGLGLILSAKIFNWLRNIYLNLSK